MAETASPLSVAAIAEQELAQIIDQEREATKDDDLLNRIAGADRTESQLAARNMLDRIFSKELPSTGTIAVLHLLDGMTLEEARPALSDFIKYSASQGKYCVRVVHGKGLGSGHRGPVLKNAVNRWLREANEVLAFCSAKPKDGGTGALYVLLRKTRDE